MKWRAWIGVVSLMVLGKAGAVGAQDQKPNFLGWRVAISHATPDGYSPSYRLFDATDHLDMSLEVFNGSSTPISFSATEFFSRIAIEATSGAVLPVKVEWGAGLRDQRRGEVPIVRETVVPLDWFTGFVRTFVLRRTDGGMFTPGVYRVAVSLADALSTVRREKGEPWNGSAAGEAELSLTIALAKTAAEEIVRDKSTGTTALHENRLDGAAASFKHVLQMDAADLDALQGLGLVYLRQARFLESIQVFETALKIAGPAHVKDLAEILSLTYLLSGDEQGAGHALAAAGYSGQEMESELQLLRTAIAQGQRLR